MQKVYIIVVTYRGWKDTIECLESVIKNDYHNYQVIVVDSYSGDNSPEIIGKWIASRMAGNKFMLLETKINGGFAYAANLAIKEIINKNDYDYIWLLDHDAVINKNTLTELIKKAEEEHIDLCGSILVDYYNQNKIQAIGGGKINFLFATSIKITSMEDSERVNYIDGASMLISKNCIKTIGMLSEEYFIYYEDADYTFLAIKSKLKVGIAFGSIVFHKEGGSTGANSRDINNKNESTDLICLRNRLIFAKKYFSTINLLFVYIGLVFSALIRIKRGQFKRAVKIIKMVIPKLP